MPNDTAESISPSTQRYRIVAQDNLHKVRKLVNDMLTLGYEPVGGIFVYCDGTTGAGMFGQALFRPSLTPSLTPSP